MNKLILILSITFSNIIYSQTEKCSIQTIQLDTYEFALNNLNRINKKFDNKNSFIEVFIEFKKLTLEQENAKDYAEIDNISYYLISPENSNSGENKKAIKVYSKLRKYINKRINNCIENSSEFKEHRYINITFHIALNKANIEKSIENVKMTMGIN